MVKKFLQYWEENTKDLITRCNFISRILVKLIFYSLGIFVLGAVIGAWLYEYIEKFPDFAAAIALLFVVPAVYIMVYSAKVFVVVIPLIWLIQCLDCIKNKRYNRYVVSNIVLWILIALMCLYSYDSGKREDECMQWCVKEDKSNYDECLFNTCDFPF